MIHGRSNKGCEKRKGGRKEKKERFWGERWRKDFILGTKTKKSQNNSQRHQNRQEEKHLNQ